MTTTPNTDTTDVQDAAAPAPTIKTPEQVKAEFNARGKTFTDWAKGHGFPRRDVYLVLNGQSKCLYGRAHEIAVAFGLKPDPSALDRSAA